MDYWAELALADKVRIVADRWPGVLCRALNYVADWLEGLTREK